jgi:glutathione-regulated potassium-efflux system ancillary protein KefG
MQKVLIIFAHPAAHKSRINSELIKSVKTLDGVTVNDIYENYPDFFINVKREQQLLIDNDIIVWHHPLYWYSCPALMKEWIDLVLEHGFAYGKTGKALHGKKVMNAVTTGGSADVYSETGRNHYTISQFLVPFHQTALLCGMNYLPPFVVHGAHMLNDNGINLYARKYKKAITSLRDGKIALTKLNTATYMNDLI